MFAQNQFKKIPKTGNLVFKNTERTKWFGKVQQPIQSLSHDFRRPDVWMIWSVWCGCSHLAKGVSLLSLDHLNNGYCGVAALSTRCGDREGVSWGDESGTWREKGTWSLCCCGNLEQDTAVDIGLLGKWSDTSNGEVSNIYLRLSLVHRDKLGIPGVSRMALWLSLSRLSWVKLRGLTLLKSTDDKTYVGMMNERVHLGVKRLSPFQSSAWVLISNPFEIKNIWHAHFPKVQILSTRVADSFL